MQMDRNLFHLGQDPTSAVTLRSIRGTESVRQSDVEQEIGSAVFNSRVGKGFREVQSEIEAIFIKSLHCLGNCLLDVRSYQTHSHSNRPEGTRSGLTNG